jgi:hypothetical protein
LTTIKSSSTIKVNKKLPTQNPKAQLPTLQLHIPYAFEHMKGTSNISASLVSTLNHNFRIVVNWNLCFLQKQLIVLATTLCLWLFKFMSHTSWSNIHYSCSKPSMSYDHDIVGIKWKLKSTNLSFNFYHPTVNLSTL